MLHIQPKSQLSRRHLLKFAAAGAAAVAASPYGWILPAYADSDAITLPKLPWPEDALAPLISKETISYHYGKHHASYVAKLNTLIKGTPYENMSLEEIVTKAPAGPIFNNAAQVWNHTFYWNCLAPNAGGVPSGAIAKAIEKSFESFAKFKEEFTKRATSLFGSGWAWLVQDPDGKLAIVDTKNAGNPLTDGKQPLLTCDVWEHAYYIDYRNRRPDYLDAYWKLVDWKAVQRRLSSTKS
jgi:Fe-Mn family superoxide dismutase